MNAIRLMVQCFRYKERFSIFLFLIFLIMVFYGKPFNVKLCTLCLYSGFIFSGAKLRFARQVGVPIRV